MTDWQIVAGPATRTPNADLTTLARGRKFVFDVKDPSSFGFSVNGRADAARGLLELATDVHAVRDGQPLFTGRLGRTADTLDGAGHTVEASCQDVKWLFTRRLVQRDRAYTNADVGTFWRDMLIDAQTGTAAGLGIVIPATAPVTGVTFTRTSKAGATIASELAAVAGGVEGAASIFDWDVDAGWGSRTPRLWVPGRGQALADTLTFIYDADNDGVVEDDNPYSSSIADLKRVLEPKDYANVVRLTGGVKKVTVTTTTPNETPTTPVVQVTRGTRAVRTPTATAADGSTVASTAALTVVRGNRTVSENAGKVVFQVASAETSATIPTATTSSTVTDSTSKTTTIEVPTEPVTLDGGGTLWEVGPFATTESYTDIVEQVELVAKTAARLAELQQVAPSYDVTLKPGYWRGPDHIWVGDSVRVFVRSGRLLEDVTLRVTRVAIDVDDDGNESVTLTVGPAATQLLTYLLDQQRQLATMARLWTP